MEVIETLHDWFNETPALFYTAYLAFVLVAAWVGNYLLKRLLLKAVEKVSGLARQGWGKGSHAYRAIRRLANVFPALVVMFGMDLVPNLPKDAALLIDKLCAAFIALSVTLAFSAVLDVLNQIYSRRPEAKAKPIKGYLQVVKIVAFLIATILVISTLANRSPLLLLSGLGAMAAVLMLIFQDTILSLVASVQISSGDMVRVGDWIEMPNLNADGDVIDIALHTVKIQNFDKTITTLPTRRLITDPFKNWRGMTESGGRRIKRALFLDQNSVRFLDTAEIERLKRFRLLDGYLNEKEEEIAQWNGERPSTAAANVNARRLTNLGTFRAYVRNHLRDHPGIHKQLTIMVRQLSPAPEGLPLEIYCFANQTDWIAYEGIQADLFDHLLAILPEFGLRVFQNPLGADFRALATA